MANQTTVYGFQRGEGEADVCIDGAASDFLKAALKSALNDLNLAFKARISSKDDNSKFQGFRTKNIVNRLSTRGTYFEQLGEARKYHLKIAGALASVFGSRLQFLVCILIGRFEQAFPRVYSPN